MVIQIFTLLESYFSLLSLKRRSATITASPFERKCENDKKHNGNKEISQTEKPTV
jgi:hypothetical protein